MTVPDSVYSDGGCVGRNPSTVGGTWAWCHVLAGRRVREASGVVTPAEVGLYVVTNNLTELLAAVLGLEALPDGWSGALWTDSKVTMDRLTSVRPLANLPTDLVARTQAVLRRLGAVSVALVAGHPRALDIADGKRTDGKPVSRHNVRCDALCREAAAKFRRGQ